MSDQPEDDAPVADVLDDLALRLRRAGLEHLVQAPVSAQLMDAMIRAGERIAAERAWLIAQALLSPTAVARPFDGGESHRRTAMRAALQFAKGSA